jgi:hypothetical protein
MTLKTSILYSARPVMVPDTVYCDTSFLVHVFTAANAARLTSLSPRQRAEAAAGAAFHKWASGRGTTFATSLVAVEEVHHLLIMTPIASEARSRGMVGWKELRSSDPARFQVLLGRGRKEAASFTTFLVASGFRLVGGGRRFTTDESHLPRRVLTFARALLQRNELDCADAFQIAFARFYGIEWAASADSDWLPTQRLNVITAR